MVATALTNSIYNVVFFLKVKAKERRRRNLGNSCTSKGSFPSMVRQSSTQPIFLHKSNRNVFHRVLLAKVTINIRSCDPVVFNEDYISDLLPYKKYQKRREIIS